MSIRSESLSIFLFKGTAIHIEKLLRNIRIITYLEKIRVFLNYFATQPRSLRYVFKTIFLRVFFACIYLFLSKRVGVKHERNKGNRNTKC